MKHPARKHFEKTNNWKCMFICSPEMTVSSARCKYTPLVLDFILKQVHLPGKSTAMQHAKAMGFYNHTPFSIPSDSHYC